MVEKITVLIVDDHPMIIEGYRLLLGSIEINKKIEILIAHNCRDAYYIIKSNCIDLAILDLSLPPYLENEMYSGIELARLVRRFHLNSKIIISTSMIDIFTLYDVKKYINPEGLLIKSDFSSSDFLDYVKNILKGETFYTFTVLNKIQDFENNKKNILLDVINRKLIILLSQGIQTKNLPQHLNLSLSAIDRRKALIKVFFEIENGTDEDIIIEAKKRGMI